MKAFLRTMAQVRHVAEVDRLDAVLQQTGPAVLIMDLRAKDCRDLIDQVQKEWPEILIIALGIVKSDPLREAEQFGIYAAEDLELDRHHFQALVGRAFDYLKILQENRDLRETSTSVSLEPTPTAGAVPAAAGSGPSLRLVRFPRVFRQFDNVDALLATVVESVADAAGVTRVGIFSKIRQGDRYQLRAGLRCLPETHEMEFGERDALVRWFELHAHLISRANLAQTPDQAERSLLRRALDTFGAEVIVPLYARGRIIGWLFFGHRLTGQRFDYSDLEGLMILAEHVSTVLENALLYDEIKLQKTLGETLLKSIPPGIVATDKDAIIRWFNPTAEQILGLSSKDVLHKPAESAGSRLAAFLRETLESKSALPAQRWIDNNTRRSLSVETRRLGDQHTPLGAVAVVHDLTAEETLREKQALVDRAAFWTDLAASMSHEIRNPLVAIKTFAQLLPERFDDADFRKDFNHIVVKEIDRLDKIITQINNFAHPPELVFKPIDVRAPVKKGIEIARTRLGANGDLTVETSLPDDLPKVLGDETALAEAFAHLVVNAAEALSGRSKPRITLSAKPIREGKHASGVLVTVRDNGKGIAPNLKGKVFSPFCTSKPRGMGLGLPIVKRTVFDHDGRVDIDSSSHGTLVSVILPARPNGH
ncbi:MAG TPA: ATP-binding protein [Chthoniobacterales bacterium]|nr:ATP-binding protein [Chthoniobacterales bacterium]